ncbi:MAG: hypothetical protein HeimC3_39880 [Candidatus Heimdallarchaeota archaeon LC_3]|nr:MAG: hypothetical protein HeimC3_39880 [Candidatus Heimdallarchaeota archaeon LC_3]
MTIKCPICYKEYIKSGWLRFHLHKNSTIEYKVLGGKLYKQSMLLDFLNR